MHLFIWSLDLFIWSLHLFIWSLGLFIWTTRPFYLDHKAFLFGPQGLFIWPHCILSKVLQNIVSVSYLLLLPVDYLLQGVVVVCSLVGVVGNEIW